MNLEIHKPELAQRLNAHLQTGQFHDTDELIEKALDALDQKPPAASVSSTARPRRHISEVICEIMSDVPLEELEKLPKDGASQVDHYLYGHPKR